MSRVDHGAGKAQAEVRTAKANAVTAALGVLSALLVLATGLLGFVTHNQTEQKQEAQAQVQDLGGDVASLRTENQRLKAQVADLQEQLAAAASTAARPSPTNSGVALPDGVTVRRATEKTSPITLQSGYMIDLDDNTSPNWNPTSPAAMYNHLEVAWISDGLSLARDYAIESTFQGYSTCARETGYHGGILGPGDVRAGQTYCIRTSENRYASVKVVKVSRQALTFAVTVWDPQYQ